MSKTKQKPASEQNRDCDLPDSDRDKMELKNEDVTMELPDVKDIPGQEFVHPPNPGEFGDTTIASADEEGDRIWSDEKVTEGSSNVSNIERKILDDIANDMPTRDEQQLRNAELDSTDSDGEALNELATANAISGSDLDTSGVDEDDENENIGEEDEENNPYSLGDDDNSTNEERTGL